MVDKTKTLHTETKFLAYLLTDKIYIGKASARIKKEYLTDSKNIFSMIEGYYSKYKGIITDDVIENKFSSKHLEADEIIKYKTIISDARNMEIVDEPHFHAIEDEIIEGYKRRQTLRIAEKIIGSNPNVCSEEDLEKVHSDINHIMTNIQSTDFDIEREGTIDGDADTRLEKYQYLKEHPGEVKAIKTGFKQIDDAIIGFGYGTTTFIAGRKGDGKSTLLLNFAYHAWKQRVNVLFFSLEIDKEQYERRWDSRAALVESKGLKSGTLSEEEEKVYKEYLQNVKQDKDIFGNKVGKIYIVDCPSAVTPAFIESKTLEIESKTNTIYDMVVVDYAGIMSANNPTGVLRDDLGQISLDLKHFARDYKKIVLSAVQMNREGKRDADGKNGKTDTSAIAGSDQIADHTDNVFTIRSIDDTMGIIESTKVRDGANFRFSFEKKYNKFQIVEVEDSAWEDI